MHICFLTSEYPKKGFPHGGVGSFIQTLGRALVQKGYKVTVVGLNYEAETNLEWDEGVAVYRLKPFKIKGLSWLLNTAIISQQLKRIHRVQPISIVEGTELSFAFIYKISGIRYVIRCHGGHHFFAQAENRKINLWKGFQERLSFFRADYIFGVSEYVLKHTASYIDFNIKRGPVIYNPIDINLFHRANPLKIVKGRIFFGGTVCEKKGIRQLILAFPIIKSIIPDAQLVVAGRDSYLKDGRSFINYLKSITDPIYLKDIIFLGAVEHELMPEWIESAEVCVYPSHMEAMPLAWLEALSMGKPFIGSRLGPGPEIIREGETGLLCNPLSPEDIAEKVLQLLTDKTFAGRLGYNARLDAEKRFCAKQLTERNIQFFKQLDLNE